MADRIALPSRLTRAAISLARAARAAAGARAAALVLAGRACVAREEDEATHDGVAPPAADSPPRGSFATLAAPFPAPWRPLLHDCFPFGPQSVAVCRLGTDEPLSLLVLADPQGPPPAAALALAEVAEALLAYDQEAALLEREATLCWQEVHQDVLTGLPNHRYFHELAENHLRQARALRLPLSAVMVDLDNFRTVNETCGYAVGDEVLREFASFLQSWTQGGEVATRYGGNQFALLLPGVGPAAALARAHDLRARLAAHRFAALEECAQLEPTLTASLAVASYPTDGQTVLELVEALDRALLEAQRLGGDRVQAYADLQAMAAEARWYALLRSRLPGRSRDVYLSTLRTLLAALEAKDSYTSSHSHGVALWSERIARFLGLPDDQVATVAIGGLLHDIGKIGIPEAILRKKGPLSPAEYAQIKEHPALGEAILRNVGVGADVVEIVLHHQERYDGRGYPAGLAGEAIPLGARIVAVADAFHSITSRRPYRPARTPLEAAAEIKRWAGVMFDPAVAAAFEQALRAAEGGQEENRSRLAT